MALPAADAPFPMTAPHQVRPRLRPLGAAPHVVLDDGYPPTLARGLQRLRDDPTGVRVRDPDDPDDDGLTAALGTWLDLLAAQLPEAVAALPDGWALPLLGVRITRRGLAAAWLSDAPPEFDPVLVAAVRTHLLGLSQPLDVLADAAALATPADLVVLRRRGRGRAACELLCVRFPSSWSPRDRAGADHAALHAPIPEARRLLDPGPALTEALLTKGPFLQHAWGLAGDGRLDRDPAVADPGLGPDPATWWLRVERQTSVPLPHLDRALFTIRLFVTQLPRLSRDQRAALAEVVASMTPAAARYKRLDAGRRAALRDWAGPDVSTASWPSSAAPAAGPTAAGPRRPPTRPR